MPMHLKSFRKWVRKVYVTQDEEIDCSEFFNLVPQYVETELIGEEANQRFPGAKHHLKQCEECYDLYLTLRDVAQLENRQIATELEKL